MPHPLIVVCGPDNAGKTVLAHDLAKRLRGIYVKTERHPKTSVDVCVFQDLLRQTRLFAPAIVDRHPAISEPIYGRIIRGSHCLERYQAVIDDCLQQFTAIIYCSPPRDLILGTLPDREQMTGVEENIVAILDAYDEFFTALAPTTPTLIRYRFTMQTVDDVMDQIVHITHEDH